MPLDISEVCICLTNECKKIIEKRVLVDTEFRGIKKPRRNKCDCLNQNNFGTKITCRAATLDSDCITLARSVAYRGQTVLIFHFVFPAVTS